MSQSRRKRKRAAKNKQVANMNTGPSLNIPNLPTEATCPLCQQDMPRPQSLGTNFNLYAPFTCASCNVTTHGFGNQFERKIGPTTYDYNNGVVTMTTTYEATSDNAKDALDPDWWQRMLKLKAFW